MQPLARIERGWMGGADVCFSEKASGEGKIVPKLKSHSGAKKRFKLTGTGKVKRSQSMKRHILTSKTKKRKRHLRKGVLVSPAMAKEVRKMISA
jgi:large subunit ribosomal protein L35